MKTRLICWVNMVQYVRDQKITCLIALSVENYFCNYSHQSWGGIMLEGTARFRKCKGNSGIVYNCFLLRFPRLAFLFDLLLLQKEGHIWEDINILCWTDVTACLIVVSSKVLEKTFAGTSASFQNDLLCSNFYVARKTKTGKLYLVHYSMLWR